MEGKYLQFSMDKGVGMDLEQVGEFCLFVSQCDVSLSTCCHRMRRGYTLRGFVLGSMTIWVGSVHVGQGAHEALQGLQPV